MGCLAFDRATSKPEFALIRTIQLCVYVYVCVCSLARARVCSQSSAERNVLQLRAPSVLAPSLLMHSDLVYPQRRSAAVMRILVV